MTRNGKRVGIVVFWHLTEGKNCIVTHKPGIYFFTVKIITNMKKVLFALPMLVFTLALVYCTKSNVQEEITLSNPDMAASNRDCTVNMVADNLQDVVFCGIDPTSPQKCTSCTGTQPDSRGTITLNGSGQFTVTNNPITFYVRTNGPGGVWINLSAGNSTGYVYVPATGCLSFTLDANCNFI